MPKDYGSRKASGKKRGGVRRTVGVRGFSARSFGGGALLGAALTLAAIYVPGLIPAVGEEAPDGGGDQAKPPALTYEFMNLLPNEEVVTGVTPYAEPDIDVPPAVADTVLAAATTTPEPPAVSPATEYLLQAASFRSRDEADALRAELLLDGMMATVNAASSPSGVAWHRVMVGPFSTKVEMERTLTTLRSKDIAALPLASTP